MESSVFFSFSIILLGILCIDPTNFANAAYPMCIVGAGISGLNLANLLEQKGYYVRVFEQNPRVGGKIETFRKQDDLMVEMSALIFTSSNTEIKKLIDKFHFTRVPYNTSDQIGFDPKTGFILPLPALTPEQLQKLQSAVHQYIIYQKEYEIQQSLEFPYLNTTADLFVSMSDWLKVRDLDVLRPLFVMAITVEGYGSLDDIPALYVLRFLTVRNMRAFIGDITGKDKFFSLYEGLDRLMDAMASELNTPVTLNATVTQIYRYTDYQVLNFQRTNGHQYSVMCQKTILALPPLLQYLNSMLPDLTDYEKSVLGEVKINRYTAAVHQIPELNDNVYHETFRAIGNASQHHEVLAPPIGNAEVVAFVKQSSRKEQHIYSSYSWIRGNFNGPPTQNDIENVERNLGSTLSKISQNASIIYCSTKAQYFPHVTTESLQNGFFWKFHSIQGNGGLYYATTLLRFETMNHAISMTEDLVEQYLS